MHGFDERDDRFNRRFGQDAVTEIEDVAGARLRLFEDAAGVGADG